MAGTSSKRIKLEDDEDKKGVRQASCLSTESIKLIAESVGIGNLHEDALQVMADEITYRLKQIVQDSKKFMTHGKRARMSTDDFDQSLKIRNVEPLYGFKARDSSPFRLASGGGRDLHYTEPKELDLKDLISTPLPKIPLEVGIKTHWLCIDGEQPAIPENPQPVSKDLQRMESMDPAVKASINKPKPLMMTEAGKVRSKVKLQEKVKLKEVTSHEMSVEQQLYYKEITEACVSSEENRRNEALHSLTNDTGMHQMLPRFTSFIAEGVKINIVQNNLALLIYLMRMVRSLLDNKTLFLEKYLHELIPSLMSCIVSKQLCVKPELDNHWALRDFASRLLQQLCKMFNSRTNDFQVRVMQLMNKALRDNTAPLATHYGAIYCLGEFGMEVVIQFVVPYVKPVADRIQRLLESSTLVNGPDKTDAEHVKQILLKILPPALKSMHPGPDIPEDYRTQYGYLGIYLHAAVLKLRQASAPAGGNLNVGPSSVINGPLRPTVSVVQKSQFTPVPSPLVRTVPNTSSRPPYNTAQSLGVPMAVQPPRMQFFMQPPAKQQPTTIFVTTGQQPVSAPSLTVRAVQRMQQPASPSPRIIYLSGAMSSPSVSTPGVDFSQAPFGSSVVSGGDDVTQQGQPQTTDHVVFKPEDYLNNAS